MLGKLLKNEFKTTYKTMLVIYIVTIVTTLGCCFFGIRQFYSYSWISENETLRRIQGVLGVTFTIAYVIIVIALVLLTYVLMCERFYKSMYSEQGYLTHTLPVSPLSNLNARLITSLVWLFVSGIILLISILLIAISLDPQAFWEDLRSFSYSVFDTSCLLSTGYSFPVFMLIILLLILAACANALLLVFAALSLGQLANLHKRRAAVGFGVAFVFLEQFAATMVMVHIVDKIANMLRGYDTTRSMIEHAGYLTRVSFQTTIWSMICIFTVFAAIYYVICAVIVKRHVNLE
ncbi:MAG: hypothetical protein HDR21_06585 [Lachnospiraceae bacterium]|nr:hypothetical protein [Lachnospiraceae bacterium]